MNTSDIESIVRQVVAEMASMGQNTAADSVIAARAGTPVLEDEEIPDIRAVDYRQVYAVANPANGEEFSRIKQQTWARLGQGRVGPRYTTAALLRFWADNATAMDAVFTDVDPALVESLQLFTVQSVCESKDDYLTDPDRGARFSPETIAEIKRRCTANPEVQIMVSDGLSSAAVAANVPDLLPALLQGLKLHGITAGTPFFVKYGRVRAMEPVAEALGAKVTCMLIGERPGLATAESLSAYLAWDAKVGMSESDRTCISNIHSEGTNPIEAGAHIADVIAEIGRQRVSGINLRL